MFRYLVIHLPLFRLERCGWSADSAVALVAEERSALRVQVATPPAARRGVRPGQTSAEARALVPELQIEVLDPELESEDLAELSLQLLRLSPALCALPPDCLVAEVQGTAAGRGGAGGEPELVERAHEHMRGLGHASRVVIADDPTTARAVAVYGPGNKIVPPGGCREALSPLTLAALELPADEHELLVDLGVRTVGDFAALAPASLVGRVGPLGVAAHAMARGRVEASALPRPGGGPLSFAHHLPDPVCELPALLFVLQALLRDATTHLAARGMATGRLQLHLCLDTSERDPAGLGTTGTQHLSLRPGQPTRDPRRLLDLLRYRLDDVQLAGAVQSVTLELVETSRFDGQQHGLLDRRGSGRSLDETTAWLSDALGPHAVITPQLQSRHLPEAEWLPTSCDLSTAGGLNSLQGTADLLADDPVHEWQGRPAPRFPERPPVLLSPPLSLDVRGSPPQAVFIDGRWHDVTGHRGPERIQGEWWDRPFQREYHLVTLRAVQARGDERTADERTAWIYREDARWALHGWFDR